MSEVFVQFFVNNNSVLVYLFSSKDQEGLEAKLKESFESHLSNVNVEFNVLGTKDLITDFISKIKAESSLFNNLDLNRFSIFENTIEIKIDNEFLANKSGLPVISADRSWETVIKKYKQSAIMLF